MPLVECQLARVVMSETRHEQAIVLRESDGVREMTIVIGLAEVYALHRIVNDEPPPRPLTHELLGAILDALGATVERAVVNKASDRIYYGRLILQQDGRSIDLDSRPSDAIVLATQKGAPIYVEESVLERASRLS
jgi:bifunctional DNase/RNase